LCLHFEARDSSRRTGETYYTRKLLKRRKNVSLNNTLAYKLA